MLLPFQGALLRIVFTQGDALGWELSGLSGSLQRNFRNLNSFIEAVSLLRLVHFLSSRVR